MFARKRTLLSYVLAVVWLGGHAHAQSDTTFTYQGSLQMLGAAYTGSADYRFSLWDTANGGAQVGQTDEALGVAVEGGVFAAGVDFGAEAFGAQRWLQIEVRTPAWDGQGNEPAYTPLDERQPMTRSPYSVQTRGIFVNEAGDRVGIGTDAPKGTLHNAGDYYGKGHIWLHANEGDGADGTAYLQARDDSGTSTIGMRLRTQIFGNVREVMSLSPYGGVGIGTNDPQTALDVVGSGRFSSSVYMAGLRFNDGTYQGTAYAPLVKNQSYPSFNLSSGGQTELSASVPGARPGMTVVVTPPYRLWNFDMLGYAYVESDNTVVWRILNNGGGSRTYGAATWRIMVFP